MKDLNSYIAANKEQLQKGDILIAYNELVKFVMSCRTELMRKLSPDYSFAGILHGYMDFTYFYFHNDFLKAKKLKFGLVLNHKEMRFELWLLGNTKAVQRQYWELLKNSTLNQGRGEMPAYSILELVLVENPDFNDLDSLRGEIEQGLEVSAEDILRAIQKI